MRNRCAGRKGRKGDRYVDAGAFGYSVATVLSVEGVVVGWNTNDAVECSRHEQMK